MGFESTIENMARRVRDPKWRQGCVFLTGLVLLSFGLKEFSQIRYDVKNINNNRVEYFREDMERRNRMKPGTTKSKSIEDAYQNMVAGRDLDSWKNVRAPRDD